MRIGIISDTHDLLRPEVLEKLEGADAILHGGDISSRQVLDRLKEIAPVYAVRGNADREWAEDLPEFLEIGLAGLRICMAHKKKDLPADLFGYDIAVFGHSHKYVSEWTGTGKNRTLLLNPGSCGPRRFHQPITMAMLKVDTDGMNAVRIEIPHTEKEKVPNLDSGDLRKQIEIVVRETQKGRTPAEIAGRYGMDPETAEQIARLYVTHPGVTADGIMTKMGL